MRKVMVIPTYWARPMGQPWQEGDAIYDHPTPVDGPDTLSRTLESMKILTDKDFKLVILVCPTAPELEEAAVTRVEKIVKAAKLPVETYVFAPGDLTQLANLYAAGTSRRDAMAIFTLNGYANVRNICLLTAAVLTADAVILIDDDEVFELPDYVERACEFLGKRVYGDTVYGVAGYYLNKNGQYYDDVEQKPWMAYWDRFNQKALAFDKYIGMAPRLKRTPFAFGGAMVIQKELFTCVPFDTAITRGEDVDYIINSRMYGFSFFLDTSLSIKHLPEPKKHPAWRAIREDIYRFVYEKAKLEGQFESANMVPVTAEDFDPYPGSFLKDNLEDKIFRANTMLALEEMNTGNVEAGNEALANIYIATNSAKPTYNPFTRYKELQKQWEAVIHFVAENRYATRLIMENHNLSKVKIVRDENHVRAATNKDVQKAIRSTQGFSALNGEEVAVLSQIAMVKTYYEGEFVFQKGDANTTFNVILKGAVRLYAGGGAEDEVDIIRLGPGDVLGESCLVYGTFSINGVAAEFTELVSITSEDLRLLIEKEPTLGVKVLQYLLATNASKLNNANAVLRSMRTNKATVAGLFIEESGN